MSSKDKRRSEKLEKTPGMITVTVSPDKLRAIFRDSKETTEDVTTPVPATPLSTKDEDDATASLNNASESMPNTPSGNHGIRADVGIEGTPDPSQASMALSNDVDAATAAAATPAVDGVTKKKGVKRSAAAAGVDGTGSTNGDTPVPAARVRSKPGPKKKAKLDDSMVEVSRSGTGGVHKLGPKASMGAINAGLRALDRSGNPCRKWAKGGFRLKSFTGVVWEIPRWRAPPKPSEPASADDSASASASATASVDDSNKENDSKAAGAKKTSPHDNKDGATNGKTNGVASNGVHTNGDTPAAASDVDMTNAPSILPSPSAEPTTGTATPVAIAA